MRVAVGRTRSDALLLGRQLLLPLGQLAVTVDDLVDQLDLVVRGLLAVLRGPFLQLRVLGRLLVVVGLRGLSRGELLLLLGELFLALVDLETVLEHPLGPLGRILVLPVVVGVLVIRVAALRRWVASTQEGDRLQLRARGRALLAAAARLLVVVGELRGVRERLDVLVLVGAAPVCARRLLARGVDDPADVVLRHLGPVRGRAHGVVHEIPHVGAVAVRGVVAVLVSPVRQLAHLIGGFRDQTNDVTLRRLLVLPARGRVVLVPLVGRPLVGRRLPDGLAHAILDRGPQPLLARVVGALAAGGLPQPVVEPALLLAAVAGTALVPGGSGVGVHDGHVNVVSTIGLLTITPLGHPITDPLQRLLDRAPGTGLLGGPALSRVVVGVLRGLRVGVPDGHVIVVVRAGLLTAHRVRVVASLIAVGGALGVGGTVVVAGAGARAPAHVLGGVVRGFGGGVIAVPPLVPIGSLRVLVALVVALVGAFLCVLPPRLIVLALAPALGPFFVLAIATVVARVVLAGAGAVGPTLAILLAGLALLRLRVLLRRLLLGLLLLGFLLVRVLVGVLLLRGLLLGLLLLGVLLLGLLPVRALLVGLLLLRCLLVGLLLVRILLVRLLLPGVALLLLAVVARRVGVAVRGVRAGIGVTVASTGGPDATSLHQALLSNHRRNGHRGGGRSRGEECRTQPQHDNCSGQPESPADRAPDPVPQREPQPHDGAGAHGEARGLTVVCGLAPHAGPTSWIGGSVGFTGDGSRSDRGELNRAGRGMFLRHGRKRRDSGLLPLRPSRATRQPTSGPSTATRQRSTETRTSGLRTPGRSEAICVATGSATLAPPLLLRQVEVTTTLLAARWPGKAGSGQPSPDSRHRGSAIDGPAAARIVPPTRSEGVRGPRRPIRAYTTDRDRYPARARTDFLIRCRMPESSE
ncbi:hypothetical protein [Pseudonocardia hierapolitana]|uniref:hypothetical protein n=1 Tax=Pseudonocardia hierapolitana TaxID=1128676 RepID=UPI0011BE926E|nr:hypothetical protein [Pseudonocardia hierapolitana]